MGTRMHRLNDDVRRPTHFDSSNWYLEISLLDMLDHHQECDSSLISLLTIDIACSSLQESDVSGSRKVPRKPSGGWSSGVVEPVSIVFNTSFRYTSS